MNEGGRCAAVAWAAQRTFVNCEVDWTDIHRLET